MQADEDVRTGLAQVELLRGLAPEVLEHLASSVRPCRWQPGDLLVEQGAPGDSLIVLLSGAVTVYRETRGGARAALVHLQAPTTLGEVTLFDGAPRSATVEAVRPCEGLELRRSDLLALVATDPAFLDALLRALGALVRRLSEQAADAMLLDFAGRVAKTLLALGDGLPAPPLIRLNQGRLAELAGGSRQSLNQVLRRFADRGLLRVDASGIALLQTAALRRRAGMPDVDEETA